MNHLDDTLLNEYLDQALDESVQNRAQVHLETCSECRSRLDDLKLLIFALSEIPEQSLARDLTIPILARLPQQPLAWGWRLLLAIQAGTALGILITIIQIPLRLFPQAFNFRMLSASGVELMGRISFHIPALKFPMLDLSTYSLPISTSSALVLLAMSVAFWAWGNLKLLRNGKNVSA